MSPLCFPNLCSKWSKGSLLTNYSTKRFNCDKVGWHILISDNRWNNFIWSKTFCTDWSLETMCKKIFSRRTLFPRIISSSYIALIFRSDENLGKLKGGVGMQAEEWGKRRRINWISLSSRAFHTQKSSLKTTQLRPSTFQRRNSPNLVNLSWFCLFLFLFWWFPRCRLPFQVRAFTAEEWLGRKRKRGEIKGRLHLDLGRKKCWIFGSNSLSFPTKKNREAQLPQIFLGLKDLRGMRAKTREVFTASLIEGEKCTLVCKEKKVVLGPRMCFRKEACLGIK